MTPLGKCLVFYFKYQPEMRRLYWQKQKPDEFADLETLKMVNAIGDKCCQEAGEFLGECGKIIEKHFQAVGSCMVEKLSDQKWTVSYGVWAKSGRRPHNRNWRMQAGVDIPRIRGEIIPWIWATGKTEAVDKMVAEFGDCVKARSDELDMPTGRVALGRIPILGDAADNFDVDRDSLLAQVEQAFAPINQQKLENVYNLVRTLKA